MTLLRLGTILGIALFAEPAFAQEGGMMSNLGVFFPLIALIAIFYFFIIRPQNKKLRDHREMVASLRRGDTIITAGGVIGKIHRVIDDHECIVEIADNVRVKMVKTTITGKHADSAQSAESAEAKTNKG